MPTPPNASVTIVVMTREELDAVIRHAARLGAEEAIRKMSGNRPAQYTKSSAAKALGISRPTLDRIIKAGTIKLTSCGRICAEDVDRLAKPAR